MNMRFSIFPSSLLLLLTFARHALVLNQVRMTGVEDHIFK
jgi:hypothetical protein